jgi:hypothetical protein
MAKTKMLFIGGFALILAGDADAKVYSYISKNQGEVVGKRFCYCDKEVAEDDRAKKCKSGSCAPLTEGYTTIACDTMDEETIKEYRDRMDQATANRLSGIKNVAAEESSIAPKEPSIPPKKK